MPAPEKRPVLDDDEARRAARIVARVDAFLSLLEQIADSTAGGMEGSEAAGGYLDYESAAHFSTLTADGMSLVRSGAQTAAIAWYDLNRLVMETTVHDTWYPVVGNVYPILAVVAAALAQATKDHDTVTVEGEPLPVTQITLGVREILRQARLQFDEQRAALLARAELERDAAHLRQLSTKVERAAKTQRVTVAKRQPAKRVRIA